MTYLGRFSEPLRVLPLFDGLSVSPGTNTSSWDWGERRLRCERCQASAGWCETRLRCFFHLGLHLGFCSGGPAPSSGCQSLWKTWHYVDTVLLKWIRHLSCIVLQFKCVFSKHFTAQSVHTCDCVYARIGVAQFLFSVLHLTLLLRRTNSNQNIGFMCDAAKDIYQKNKTTIELPPLTCNNRQQRDLPGYRDDGSVLIREQTGIWDGWPWNERVCEGWVQGLTQNQDWRAWLKEGSRLHRLPDNCVYLPS